MSDFELHPPRVSQDAETTEGFNLSALAVRERSVTLFFLLAIVIAGTVAYLKLGRAEDPTFSIKVFTVTAAWPGATAQEMQDLVADPLEKRMQEPSFRTTHRRTKFKKSSTRDARRSKTRPHGFPRVCCHRY